MRKKIKKEIKGIIQTMSEAHEHAFFLLQNKRIAEANDILSQCQDCAVHIGESIEQSEGMDTKAVSHLENYCEHLFKMSRTIEKKKLNGLKHQLDSSLKQVEYEIDVNIPQDRLKIVFLPYKASMWDCMESVWEAADADEECDAYVVPIPYYERNEQGGAEKFCYEGDMFPKEVPITSYEEFSLEAERPDIVYIHNPYDGNNYVTSVHPDYYTENLKKYVDELVYIPYYILGRGGMPEMHKSLAAYNNIDKIIVQDEDKKESMLDYVPEEKIVAIGCPKVDRILKLDKRKQEILEHEIPQEWRKKIAGKKVILFNVSITGILNNKRYAMDKIRYVLSCFENRDDVVLLWRPHPLVEATLKSMRPEMYEEYMSIKKSFIRKGKGIFDETGDAGVAAVVADAYLGENSSSLVHYFGVLGKPVMYINWTVAEDELEDSRGFLYFLAFYKEEEALFFVPHNKGSSHDLYQLDLGDGKLSKVMTFPGSSSDSIDGFYLGIKKVQNKIALIPHNGEDVYLYDLDKKQAIKIVLPESEGRMMLFGGAVEYDGRLFLLPKCYPAIVSIDLQNLEVCEYQECVRPFCQEEKNARIFTWACHKKEKYLYLASCNDSRMLIFNMEDGSFEKKNIGEYPYGYAHMIYDGEYFWLAAYRENHVVRWDEKTGDTKEYTYPIEQDQPIDEVYSQLINGKDELIICYGRSTDISFINKKTGECRQRREINTELARMRKESAVNSGGFSLVELLDEENAALFHWRDCSLNIWNISNNQWKRYPCRLPVDEKLRLERGYIEKYCISRGTPYSIWENAVTVSMFIDYMMSGSVDIFRNPYECYHGLEGNSSIGAGIHERLAGRDECGQ